MKNDNNSNVRKYQTEDEILEDLCKIAKSDLSVPAKAKLYDHLCWKFTELDGKYCGVKYWSSEAYKIYLKKKENKNWQSGLRHEHIVPKCIFIDWIFENQDICAETLKNAFQKNMIACIVTAEEDRILNNNGFRTSMPDGNKNFLEINDPWARYKACNIEVLELKWSKGKRSAEIV